jgi:hypothetical protein
VAVWRSAQSGAHVDWHDFLADFSAAVDWPASAFWRQTAAAFPDALVLLSMRDDRETWWRSVDNTILTSMRKEPDEKNREWHAMAARLFTDAWGSDWDDRQAAMSAYDRHNAAVRDEIPPERLLVWQPNEGWGPICERLGTPVPDEPFPRVNTSEEWAQRRDEETET